MWDLRPFWRNVGVEYLGVRIRIYDAGVGDIVDAGCVLIESPKSFVVE